MACGAGLTGGAVGDDELAPIWLILVAFVMTFENSKAHIWRARVPERPDAGRLIFRREYVYVSLSPAIFVAVGFVVVVIGWLEFVCANMTCRPHDPSRQSCALR